MATLGPELGTADIQNQQFWCCSRLQFVACSLHLPLEGRCEWPVLWVTDVCWECSSGCLRGQSALLLCRLIPSRYKQVQNKMVKKCLKKIEEKWFKKFKHEERHPFVIVERGAWRAGPLSADLCSLSWDFPLGVAERPHDVKLREKWKRFCKNFQKYGHQNDIKLPFAISASSLAQLAARGRQPLEPTRTGSESILQLSGVESQQDFQVFSRKKAQSQVSMYFLVHPPYHAATNPQGKQKSWHRMLLSRQIVCVCVRVIFCGCSCDFFQLPSERLNGFRRRLVFLPF